VSEPSAPDAPLGPPLIGALLRMPLDLVRARMLAALHESGFTDVVPAHLVLLRWPGPQGRRPSEIAAESEMSKQAVNYLLGQLETLGYLERRTDPDDHRSRQVHLTARGRDVAMTMRRAVSEIETEWTALLGHDDFEHLRALLTRLSEGLTRSAQAS
jgi:DNA-binding MarR family transcriptional regulator